MGERDYAMLTAFCKVLLNALGIQLSLCSALRWWCLTELTEVLKRHQKQNAFVVCADLNVYGHKYTRSLVCSLIRNPEFPEFKNKATDFLVCQWYERTETHL